MLDRDIQHVLTGVILISLAQLAGVSAALLWIFRQWVTDSKRRERQTEDAFERAAKHREDVNEASKREIQRMLEGVLARVDLLNGRVDGALHELITILRKAYEEAKASSARTSRKEDPS